MFERVSSSVLGSESSCTLKDDRMLVYHDESLDNQEAFNLGFNEPKTVGSGSMSSLMVLSSRTTNTIIIVLNDRQAISICLSIDPRIR